MNYYNEIIELINVFSKNSDIKKNVEYGILIHLIMLLGEERFNDIFKIYFIEAEGDFSTKFYNFHKMMRQTDFYNIKNFEKNGHIDMLFWNFIHLSNIPEIIFKSFLEYIQECD